MLVTTASKYKIKRWLLSNGALLLEDIIPGRLEGSGEPQERYSKHVGLDIPNLYIKIFMKTLVSYGWVEEFYVWRHFYFTLTPLGETKLREELVFTDDNPTYRTNKDVVTRN